MLTHITDYPIRTVKQNDPLAGTHKKLSTPLFPWNFEVQDSDIQDTYRSHDHMLMHNDLNAYVVDWEMPRQENVG